MAEAVVAAGIVVAVACLAVSSWIGKPASTGIDAAAIREAVSRVPATDVYRAWQSFSQAGVAREATADEAKVARLTRNRAALSAALVLVAGAAAAAAIGAAAVAAFGRRAERS